jgi:hypothetical protein
MDKLFTVAGYSTHNSETKVRFATSMDRVKVLARNGHTDIKLQELPRAMTKADAVAYLESSAVVAPAVAAEMPDAVADARAKNLETIRRVHQRMKAAEARSGLREEAKAEVEELEFI